MSNKVTNIYIDTTGFCDEAIERVKKALDKIVKHNAIGDITPSRCAPIGGKRSVFFNPNGEWISCNRTSWKLNGLKKVGLWELESIADGCGKEKKQESLPTRNIYIDARNLGQQQRLEAFDKINELSDDGGWDGWSPNCLAEEGREECFILFDIFSIDEDGDRWFYSGDCTEEIYAYLQDPKELTYDQLMSLSR